MEATPKRVKCANCGIEIKWAAIEKEGKKFCWEGCAEGDPVPIRLQFEEDGEEDVYYPA